MGVMALNMECLVFAVVLRWHDMLGSKCGFAFFHIATMVQLQREICLALTLIFIITSLERPD